MPVSAEQITYSPPSASETGESLPETIATISILGSSMVINSGLDAKNFVAGYRTGKPISAGGRRRSDQYDRQTLAATTIDAAVQKGLNDLPAQEAEQDPGRDIVIRPERHLEIRYFAYGLGVLAIVALGRAWLRRRLRTDGFSRALLIKAYRIGNILHKLGRQVALEDLPCELTPKDLRERVLADCDAGILTIDVATKYRVSQSWICG